MVNIIDGSLGVHQLNQVLDNLNNILLRQDTDIHISIQVQFLVDAITTHITQVIAFVREEQVLDDLTSTGIISRVCIT